MGGGSVIALAIEARTLLAQTPARSVALEKLEAGYRVRALVAVGYDPEVARVFGFGGERNAVVSLARRKRVIL